MSHPWEKCGCSFQGRGWGRLMKSNFANPHIESCMTLIKTQSASLPDMIEGNQFPLRARLQHLPCAGRVPPLGDPRERGNGKAQGWPHHGSPRHKILLIPCLMQGPTCTGLTLDTADHLEFFPTLLWPNFHTAQVPNTYQEPLSQHVCKQRLGTVNTFSGCEMPIDSPKV